MHTGNIWTGEPVNQYGFGVYKSNPYQKGYGAYRTGSRRQKGFGLGSLLMGLGRRIVPKLIPLAKKVAKGAARQGLKALPGLLSGHNTKSAAKNLVKNIGKQVLGQAAGAFTGGSAPMRHRKRRKFGKRVKRVGQFTRGHRKVKIHRRT